MTVPAIPSERLRRLRLASQRLTPERAAANPVEAAGAVVGIQAQDLRAMGLALRSRVPGLERQSVLADSELIRTWTVRGTVHLHAADDLPWLGALTTPRSRHRSLGPRSVNILMPWAAAQGWIVGLADGRFVAAEPPPPVAEDEALATLGRRYLGGYGPAGVADLAKWSGLPVSMARRALDAAGPLEATGDGELLVLPGTLDGEPPTSPSALLLAPFDTSMLGWRTREPLVATADDARALPGGGMVKAVLLARGRAAATWRAEGTGQRRTLLLDRFGRAPTNAALRAEAADVGRFLGIDLDLDRAA